MCWMKCSSQIYFDIVMAKLELEQLACFLSRYQRRHS